MKEHVPDTLPPLLVDFGVDAYGNDVTFVREHKPLNPELAQIAFNICKLGIYEKVERLENMYPAHVGGVEQYNVLRALAKQYGVELQFPAIDKK